jgi:hypothetical protein
MRQWCFVTAAAVLFLLVVTPLCAWNDAGHLTIARIAWERLNESQRAKVIAGLRNHPHRQQLLLKDRPADATDAEWMFLRAAVWCDHVRPPKSLPRDQIAAHPIHKFHRGSWHYVNYPYRAGQTESTLPAQPLVGEGPQPTNIVRELELTMRVLKDAMTSDPGREAKMSDDENKAVRLCWLFHLIGDLHQPLHAATLIDEQKFPNAAHSDLGGNLIAIRSHVGAPPCKLHAFWDDRLGTDSHFPTVCSLAEILTHDPALAPDQLPEFTEHREFQQWTAESYQCAKATTYQDGQLKFALWDDYDHRRITVADVPILAPGAEAKANVLARRRIVLAGYRLAEKLKEIVER